MYLLLNLVLFIMIFGVVPVAVTLGLAGRWGLWNVWMYAGIGGIWVTFLTLETYLKSPDLLKERLHPADPGRVRWTSARAGMAMSILQWIIAGLDQRFHWSDVVPLAGVVAGLVIYAISWGLFIWAAAVNRFFSSVVRIQADRGQQVIREGPYTIVRHPGYASSLWWVAAGALALNSLLSIIPALIYLAITIQVTAIEDQMLQDELPGYVEYAAKVRYRLIPGVW